MLVRRFLIAVSSMAFCYAQTPAIFSISPSSPFQSSTDQSVTVSGSGFQAGLTVTVFFPGGATGTLSGSQIQNLASSSFRMVITLGSAGSWGIRVNNPNGQRSSTFNFTVQSPPVPSISFISPSSPTASGNNESVLVNGGNFQSGLTVDVYNSGGTKIATLSGTQIQSVGGISFTMLINLGTAAASFGIEVVNPNGGRSPRFTFSAATLTPTVSSINPASPPASGKDEPVQVNGSNFQSTFTVEVFNSGGVKIATLTGAQIQNPTAASFTALMNLGTTASSFGIEVVNQSGKRSARFTFLSSAGVSVPTLINAPSSGAQLTTTFVTQGSGFTPNTAIQRFMTPPGGNLLVLANVTSDATGRFSFSYTTSCSDAPGVDVQMKYFGDGKLAEMGGARYLEDPASGGNRILAELDGSGGIQRGYVHGLGMISMVSGPAANYFLHNLQGSTVAVTDGGGVAVATHRYDPFGRLVQSTGNLNVLFTFLGRHSIPNVGGYSVTSFRLYDSSTGRFTSPDPAHYGLNVALSPFVYAGQSPLGLIDPSGLSAIPSDARRTVQPVPTQYSSMDSWLYRYTSLADNSGLDSIDAVMDAVQQTAAVETLYASAAAAASYGGAYLAGLGVPGAASVAAGGATLLAYTPHVAVGSATFLISYGLGNAAFGKGGRLNPIIEGRAIGGVQIPGLGEFTKDVVLDFPQNSKLVWEATKSGAGAAWNATTRTANSTWNAAESALDWTQSTARAADNWIGNKWNSIKPW